MRHSVNMALQRLVETGLPASVTDPSFQSSEELDALTSTRFTDAVKARSIVLATYRELIPKQGLKAVRRPAR